MKGLTVSGRDARRVVAEARDGREDARRQQLIEATVATIGKRGYARTTLAHVTDQAKLSRGIANFYFKSKESLLLATLKHLTDEYVQFWRKALERAGPAAADRLDALIEAEFHPRICRRDRIAAWFAFWGEARTRKTYGQVCSAIDMEYFQTVVGLIEELVRDQGGSHDPEVVAGGLCAMMNGFQHDYLMDPERFDRHAARRACRTFLAGLYPDAFGTRLAQDHAAPRIARPRPRRDDTPGLVEAAETLPGWTYNDREFFALEREHIFKRTWQFVCHVNDIPETGQYVTLAFAGERVFAIRDRDGKVRAFHNTCRHRAACLASGNQGRMVRAIVCPYHAWSYDFDGTLAVVPGHETFPALDRAAFGLLPLETEIWNGLVFVRLVPGGPAVATMMAPYEAELAPFRFAESKPLTDGFWVDVSEADWKNVMDNFLEGYHIPAGHPGLQRMFGNRYDLETRDHGVARAFSVLRDQPSKVWSERAYQSILPEVPELPGEWRRAWVYYSLFPTTTLNIAPHGLNVFQILPLAPGRTTVRGKTYGTFGDSRGMKAARWLSSRINRQIYIEDDFLVRSVQAGLESTAYTTGRLSQKEACVRQFQDEIRARLPVARLRDRPAPGRVQALNDAAIRRGAN